MKFQCSRLRRDAGVNVPVIREWAIITALSLEQVDSIARDTPITAHLGHLGALGAKPTR